jgi:hypothetical protein
VIEFERTSLLTLAASIGTSDPWMMDAWSRAVTLIPLRMMSATERRSSSDQALLLDLTDLGRLRSSDDGQRTHATSPLRSQSNVALLVPWSLLAGIAELDSAARSSSREIPSCYASDDWLTTWHHFVDDGSAWEASTHDGIVAKRRTMLHSLPFEGSWHFVLASVAVSSEAPRESDRSDSTHRQPRRRLLRQRR